MPALKISTFWLVLVSVGLAVGLALFVISCSTDSVDVPPPPETRTVDVTDTLHGVAVSDPYRWLEDQESPATRAWIDAQNAYTDRVLDQIPGRPELKDFLTKLIRVDSKGMPAAIDGRYFFFKRAADQDLPVFCLRQGLDGEDQVLLDPHAMSPDKATTVGLMDISKDATRLLYAVRKGGVDETEVRLMDVDAKKDLPDVLPRAVYFGTSLTLDKKGIYYARRETKGPRVYFHAVGSDPVRDKLVFGEGFGPEMIISAGVSENGRWLMIYVLYGSASDQTDIYLKDLKAGGPIFPLIKDIPARFEGFLGDDRLFIHTNWNAPNGRVMVIDPLRPAQADWREIVPERKDASIQGLSGAGGKLFVNYLQNVKSKVEIFDPDGLPQGEIAFPSIGSVGGVNGLWTSGEAFYSFTSFHIPTAVYRYDVAAKTQSVWSQVQIPLDVSRFEVKQVGFKSKDGTPVPMFIVQAKGLKLDGSHRALLTGYGGFNAPQTPGFSITCAAWVEKGGVFAVPNLRGGGEFGEKWHRAGMLDKKQNVFDDFIAAAEFLIQNKYTSAKRLAITGGSNGGLLVGAALTQRPDLFGAVVCTFPVLDMLRYQHFLMGKYWVSEYGSADDPEQFKHLFAYSPYHRVVKGTKYPAVLFITGDADTRVAPLHARKMAALLQADSGSGKPVLLRYHVKAGHSGGMPVDQQVDNLTDTMSFLKWQLK